MYTLKVHSGTSHAVQHVISECIELAQQPGTDALLLFRSPATPSWSSISCFLKA
jgi:hypothetical protein